MPGKDDMIVIDLSHSIFIQSPVHRTQWLFNWHVPFTMKIIESLNILNPDPYSIPGRRLGTLWILSELDERSVPRYPTVCWRVTPHPLVGEAKYLVPVFY